MIARVAFYIHGATLDTFLPVHVTAGSAVTVHVNIFRMPSAFNVCVLTVLYLCVFFCY
jgi:hypothetical protein